MKKRVISWLLCLALCLSMLPMAALAEDVQAPEGPAPSLNEPQPEPRAKENETPAPEPEKKVQSELMTAEKLLMPLSLDESSLPFTVGKILAEQDSEDIGTDGVIGVETTLRVVVSNITTEQLWNITQAGGLTMTVDGVSVTQAPAFAKFNNNEYCVYSVFTPTQTSHSVCVTITYNGIPVTRTRELTFTKCSHPGIKSGNTCSQCGATLVAEINSATYYETLSEALDAAQEADAGSTVTLLADCSLSSYELQNGTILLDLNGHKLTQPVNPLWVSGTANLTVKNNNSGAINCGRFCVKSKTATLSVTIGSKYEGLMTTIDWQNVSDFLDSDMGYQINRKWADALAIRRMSIENVTVAKAPFTTSDITVSPENAYVNREATLSVTLSEFQAGQAGTEATCEYSVRYGTNYTYQKSLKKPTYTADQAFAVEFTPSEEKYYIQAVITSGEFSVVKTLEKTFKTCAHGYGDVDQNTGFCSKCKSQMAASVSSTHYVNDRKYYETFDLAMNAAWKMLKSQDCWFTVFQDAQVGTIEYLYPVELDGKTLYMDLNEKTLTSSGVAFRVQGDKWKLDITNGTVIGDTSGYKPVNGVIEVAAGGYLNVHGTTTIKNKGAETNGVNAPSIMVHGSSTGSGTVRGVAEISGDKNSDFGSLFISGGDVKVNGGTYDHAKVTYGGSLEVSNGKFQGDVTVGDVTVDDHALLTVGSKSAYFDGKLTFEPYGSGMLTNGNYKHIITKGATLGKLSNNTLDVFYIGEDYQPNAKNQAELKAGEDTYITIRKHKHDFSNSGTCACGEKAEAYLSVDGQQQYGYFDDMLALAEKAERSCVYLRRDVTIIRDTEVKEGNFSIAGGSFKVTCSGPYALVFGGGTVSIGDGTFDRLKVKDTGKLTLNGGKYYAIDVTDSTYANYGGILGAAKGYKTASGWETASTIGADEKSFTVTGTPKEVAFLPLRSVTISVDGETTVPYGTSVKFTATVESNSSSGITYKWYRNGVAIQNATTNTLVANEPVGDYTYRCEVTRDNYMLSSNTVQLTVQRIDLSNAALSATIQTRAYDGSANATVTASSIGDSSLMAGTDYTISAEFEDANAGKGKKVTVKVTLTNRNYCFGYKSDGTPIMERTFQTTGTIMQDTTPIEKLKKIEVYSGIAHTYTIDLDACLSNLQNLGFESYEITEKNIVVAKLIDANQVVLEGHSLKIPVNAVITTPSTEAAKFTITVTCKNYSNVTIRVRVVTKDRLQVTATATPSKSELTYGEKLGSITLSGKTTPELEGTFAWRTPDVVLDAGTYPELGWKFTPDNYTYAEASGTAEITVKQAKLTDPAPVTLTIYNGWAGTYEAALPELPALAEGLYFGKNTAYGEPDVSAGRYYSSGAELKTVNGKQGVSIPILKNETTKEGQVGTITVQYTSQNYKPVTLAINLVAKNRTAPTFILTADHDTLSGGGKVTLTLERGNLPDGAVVTVSGTDEAGNPVTLTDNGDGTYSATLPNKTQTYTFIAAYDGSQTIAPKTDFTTVKVQQRSSGGGEPAKPSFPVKISNSGDGVAKVDKSYANAGAKVTITVTPGRNGSVQRITVTDEDGERLKLTENRDGTYSFTMPNGAANVYARFSGSGLPFADVRRGSYYEQAIAWASENGIVTGFDASTFAPDRAITREQLAAILFRFAAYRGMDAVTLRENLSSFQDQAAISAYAVSALNWAVGEGLMQGTGDKLEPTGNATRAQVAAMLRRFMQRNF